MTNHRNKPNYRFRTWKFRDRYHLKGDTLQDVITEVGKSQPSIGDRKVEAIINQLISGQVGLNYLTSKIDKNKSPNCDLCSEKETIDHYIFKCQKYH